MYEQPTDLNKMYQTSMTDNRSRQTGKRHTVDTTDIQKPQAAGPGQHASDLGRQADDLEKRPVRPTKTGNISGQTASRPRQTGFKPRNTDKIGTNWQKSKINRQQN